MIEPMDKTFWESHWRQARIQATGQEMPANPHLAIETRDLEPGTVLDAGCGEGAEALWLALQGWAVTAADISREALARAFTRISRAGLSERVRFVEADLSTWQPDSPFDLVTTHYAHSAIPQLALYDRISHWVAPGGTLLIVGHLRTPETGHGHGQPPEEATVTAASVAATLTPALWDVVTASEQVRTSGSPGGAAAELHDVVVRATRRL
jgi:SAM-dependent methyltransferase